MNAKRLNDRIRSVRVGARAKQPLQYRIDLVRQKRAATNYQRPQAFEASLKERK